MLQRSKRFRVLLTFPGILLIMATFLVACGGASATNSAAMPASGNSQAVSSGSQATAPSSYGQGSTPSAGGPQYLIKTMKINMQVQDTRQVAADLQVWIATTDPRSTTVSIDYEQVDNNDYTVVLSFSVQASMYEQIRDYLRDYAPKHNGTLLNFTESTQDVTNDYIDTQSRLKNLHTEQTRLLTLLSGAQALGDILTIEQKLTDVEGQIEQIEAHLNALNGQVTYYTITIGLQPPQSATPTPQPGKWDIGQVFHDAIAGSISFGQGLLTFLIWLVAYGIYAVPVVLIAWFLWRRRNRAKIPPVLPAAPK